MAQINIEAGLTGNMAFKMELDGHTFITDADLDTGGNDLGPRPKKLLLAGLIGCTGIDVVSILKKMKVELDDMKLEAKAESSEEHPRVYTKIHLTYYFKGRNLPEDKLKRAVALSQDRYCGVSAMLKKAADISYNIVVE